MKNMHKHPYSERNLNQ